jgi:hypothetical protein
MAYHLGIGRVHVWSFDGFRVKSRCNCKQAKGGCRPAFVFSIPGQVGFRTSLNHLKACKKRSCSKLRRKVITSIKTKLDWLWEEGKLLGCVQIQPLLYGSSSVILKKRDFEFVAHHLANCPQESCAQLRRALLLKIRDQVGVRNFLKP